MKVYKFIFSVGLVNLIVPFLGITFVYKQYVIISLECITIGYALILRAIEKEKENFKIQKKTQENKIEKVEDVHISKKIEDVVEMQEEIQEKVIVSDIQPKRRGRKPKILVTSMSEYE